MTTLYTLIGGYELGNHAKRVDIWRDCICGIGRWEVLLDNGLNWIGSLAIPPEAAVDLRINSVILMKGYLDDKLPYVKDTSAVYLNLIRMIGRDYGQDLANLFLGNPMAAVSYINWKIDDIIDNALLLAGSEITYTSASTGAVVPRFDFKKTYLNKGFEELAKQENYDFHVDDDKAFQLWALDNAPSTGVVLKSIAGDATNNILKINPAGTVGVDIKNLVLVDGGNVDDHWTESNAAAFTGEDCTVADDTTVFLPGKSSIKVTLTTNNPCLMYLPFPNYYYTYLPYDLATSQKCSVLLRQDGASSAGDYFQVYLKDTEGNEIVCWICANLAPNTWTEGVFCMGPAAPFGNNWDDGKWFYLTQVSTFNWRIVRIGIRCRFYAQSGVHFWVDGLRLGGVTAVGFAEDPTSKSAYRPRMIPLNRTDLKSQAALQAFADSELAKRKDPTYKLTLTCTLQTAIKYAGYTVEVRAPDSGIGTVDVGVVYRILSLHHTAEPGADLCRGHDAITELDLIKHTSSPDAVSTDRLRSMLYDNPAWAFLQRHDERLRVLEQTVSAPTLGTVITVAAESKKDIYEKTCARRMQEDAFVYTDGDYVVCRGKVLVAAPPLGHQHCSWATHEQFGYGAYEWKGKILGCDHGEEYPGGFENHHGFPLEGLITFLYLDGVYKSWTSWAGSQTFTTLAGEDWTTEKTFKIVWDSTHVYFYVNNVLKATHTTNIPQDTMGFFFEACPYRGSATIEAAAYYRINSFEKLA